MTDDNIQVELDFSGIKKKENPDMEKYFEIAGKCEDGKWHSAESFEFNITGPGEYDYNKKCPNCGKELTNSEHNTLEHMEKSFGLGREKEHPLESTYGGDSLLDYKTEELDTEQNGFTTVWVRDGEQS